MIVHAVSPATTQGASLAIEDAIVLAKCLRDFPRQADALRIFEQVRRTRVEHVAQSGASGENPIPAPPSPAPAARPTPCTPTALTGTTPSSPSLPMPRPSEICDATGELAYPSTRLHWEAWISRHPGFLPDILPRTPFHSGRELRNPLHGRGFLYTLRN
jgi:hypothetical protein